jgi:alkanesulfonate monooxygenase SsuD/methylene tetrahydromethanopterin reductase-like flavin-dependent oxidoreductase (luciferase family)
MVRGFLRHLPVRHAEKCGFESLYMSEHIVMYPGATLPGYVPLPSDLAVADPLECLAYVAAGTSTLLLGTAVLLLPYHHPVVLAKRLATIDVLSRGRMSLLTVGLGVLPGEYFSLAAACSFPKPHDGRILPVHAGGSSLAAARRAGRRGDGYFPGGRLTSEQRAEQITVMRAEAAAAGRDPAALEYTRWGQFGMTADEVQARASQGVTRLVVSPSSTELAAMQAELSSFAHRLGRG